MKCADCITMCVVDPGQIIYVDALYSRPDSTYGSVGIQNEL